MKSGRIGQGSFVAIFVILAAALTVTGWYHSQTTAAEQQGEILAQSEIDLSEANLNNLQLYTKTSLGIAASRAAGETGELGGRLAAQRNDSAKYWVCEDGSQAPSRQTVRYTMSNFTMEFLDPRLSQLHGRQGEYLYQVGEQTCAEVGYREPVDDPKQSDNFLAATSLDEAGVYQQDGSAVREDKNVSISERIEYNRLWFIHDGAGDWAQTQPAGFEESVRAQLQEIPDISQAIQQGCGSADCPQMQAPQWTTQHPDLITEAVTKGINEQLDTLETEYLDQPETDRTIQCEFNYTGVQGDDDTYPTYRVNFHGAGSDVFQDTDDGSGGGGNATDTGGNATDTGGNETDGGEGAPDPNCRKEDTEAGCNCQNRTSTCASYSSDDVNTYTIQSQGDSPSAPQTDGGGGGGGCGTSCTAWGDSEMVAITEYAYTYDVWADINVTCTDRQFEAVYQADDGAEGAADGDEGADGSEGDDLGHQVLNFNVQFSVSENSVDHEFVCSFNSGSTDFENSRDPDVKECMPVEQKAPHSVPQCGWEDQERQMCDTGINTVELTE